MKTEFHEAANIFPLDDGNIDQLAGDISKNGQQVAIETLGGKIIDGRRRWLACEKAGVKPVVRAVFVDDPISYVLSLNLHRRHLTPSQLAMVGARARGIYDRQAKERMQRGKKPVENLPQGESGKARDAVGKTVGVENAEPEVVKAVDEGRMAVSTAVILSSESPDKQRQEANNPKRNRDYKSCSKVRNGKEEPQSGHPEPETNGKIKGVGVIRANEAINCLIRIPKNDALRKRGFQIVTDWIKHNQ